MHRDTVFDLIGIGFGPSNLALAVRLAEEAGNAGNVDLAHCFIERQPEFGWHRGMLLDDCRMQISFLKDLVTLRDPKSRFTFINYLFERGRLADFVNLKSFYPTRVEFHDYLSWVAASFDERVHYGQTVIGIEAIKAAGNANEVDALRVFSRDEEGREWQRVTRALSVGIGGGAQVPEAFAALGSHNIVHSSKYLTSIDRVVGDADGPRKRVAVIGAGQSAAEVFVDLTRRYPHVDASLVIRSSALKPADDSPFVNEIFSPAFTDIVYAQPRDGRRSLIERFRDTNYAVVDRPLIEQIYEMLYMQNVSAEPRHRLLANTGIETAVRTANGQIELTLRDRLSGHARAEQFDALVLATGYRRDTHVELLEGLAPHLGDALAQGNVERDYRLGTPKNFKPRIYLQGCCEDSHGLSDTLLSVLALRADEIVASLARHTSQDRSASRTTQTEENGTSKGRMAFAL
ncbi:lysine N(6)-hydroxylase/L-ornithine N(5)-oxygenase family protein [Paraburkholderia domus]|jgi:Lysine/ornithine N-monooxygenase|uniref:L-ornithine N(5)-monooxygenase n=1 Tax=Paraburkholderia domus TaxID=2793075 RepID=A0A9N8MLN0_9BURK|nr:lysine N(6)-hydroxylase/L-ornithine N(5)-oxygenase family protein [Paraburkholderia domus]MBK5049144.1 lysine N(6)-hydroxylase/L-ornithine N(5)-oxygenase family protein [Burkholderia sp. R-70006]MBK5060113.1 lysine N(6)-hydroxylase/L-ornithine N(5)-oxygenase family protein [Burkholderia sp. R-70199]MBK5118377.1 lysine N(6)-hydroxylase/L-ornithine N(5)-oxygenase family protein [Burkholderia sp. R-69980]MBK5164214.1 lysine N(6)-hydroxylase/L-ornithine N(5)-oxygenase family protein [Burkholderi